MGQITKMPNISIIVPCVTEAKHIRKCLESIAALSFEGISEYEILVVDGMSTDGTRETVREMATHDGRIRLLDNPRVITACGLNIGIGAARFDHIIRCDAHSEYSQDYLVRGLAALEASNADVVGGPWVAGGRTAKSRAIAAVFQNGIFSIGAKAHRKQYSGLTDTVYLGFYRRSTFERFGLFDEVILRNEDDEFNLRVNLMGGKVWQSADVRSIYYVREEYGKLWRQYEQYGYWKLGIFLKHGRFAKFRHLLPHVAFFCAIPLVVGSVLDARWGIATGSLVVLYGLYTFSVATAIAGSVPGLRTIHCWWAMLLMQGSYCFGAWSALFDKLVLRRYPRKKYFKLTR